MAPQFDKPLRDLLRAAGCVFVRQGKGSHEIWHSPITKRNFAVPVASCRRPRCQLSINSFCRRNIQSRTMRAAFRGRLPPETSPVGISTTASKP
jgi:hypothetical protein